MSDILIKKSLDDVPSYQIFRVTEKKGRLTQYELIITTNDLVLVARYLCEW